MIYIGNNQYIDKDTIIILIDENEPSYVYGDIIENNVVIGSCLKYTSGVLLTDGSIFGVLKNGKVIRMISTEPQFPNFKASTSRKNKSYNEYCVIQKDKYKDLEHYGSIINYLGEIGNLNVEKEYLEYLFNLKYKKIKNINKDSFIDMFESSRVNLEEKCYSIDPQGCYDIDDALHINKNGSNIEIGVHIADVSCLIPVGSQLDKLLMEQGESVYLNYKQIDTMPKEYVDELSLFEKQNKKCFSVIITFNNYQIVNTEFKRTYITVDKNLSYKQAAKLKIKEVEELFNFGKKLYDKEDYDIHKTVEVFMILANKLVAKKIKEIDIYKPILRKYSNEELLLDKSLDNKIKEKIGFFNSDKAFYSLENTHQTLGEYTHFTSPIRRYVDIITHRMLWNSINNINEPVVSIDLNRFIEKINFRNIIVKKASRESIRLMESYNREKNNNTLETKEGIIVRLGNSSIVVYFEEYNFTVNCQVIPNDIKHDWINNITHAELLINKEGEQLKFNFKLGQKVTVNIISAFFSPKLKNKLIGQLVEPDIRSIYLL